LDGRFGRIKIYFLKTIYEKIDILNNIIKKYILQKYINSFDAIYLFLHKKRSCNKMCCVGG